ncbi:hypothetical protein OSC27_10125 [Microbacterium sp. STN6]|uniref:hypothetical protein n=1 Tax=Microbacterium sp. STN6 TaxID=2995588 RepID=UPI0022609620|nr:hypothetical protein [Microbacterium sp. STN6]MCX7522631.1 hypothetical protein [Microbacterium sp. STN6]
MADLHVYPDRLEIRLTAAEKVLAMRRAPLVVPRHEIKSVAITADPWIWIRGIRAPGAFVPLTLAVGTWKFHGGKDFLLIKGKQRSAVVIDLEQDETEGSDGGEFARIIVSTSHATRLIEALRLVDPDELAPEGEAI